MPLEKEFHRRLWDQRGNGTSYERNITKSSMTVEQFIATLDGLVEAVRKHLGKTKVAIFGHSRGSALGGALRRTFPGKAFRCMKCRQCPARITSSLIAASGVFESAGTFQLLLLFLCQWPNRFTFARLRHERNNTGAQ